MRSALHGRGRSVAILAAFALVVQTLLSAWAGAAMAGQPTHDAFGNPLCIGNTVYDSSAPSPDHGSIPACCMLGCGATYPVLSTPAAHAEAVRVEFSRAVPAIARSEPAPASHREHDPGSPRAPPPSV